MTDSHAADVQAELQAYLNSKNINSLFIAIVESLLIEKPSNPIGYIVEYLNKQYPDLTKGAIESIAGPRAAVSSGALDAKAESKTVGELHRVASKKAAAKSDDTDDEDEDDVADLQVKPVPANTSTKERRRVSVSAESVDPAKMKAQRANLVSVEKPADVTARLQTVVSHSPLLRTLDEEHRDQLIKAFTGPEIKQPGETVIKQGDIGDVFYLLEEGNIDVFIKKGDADETKVHTYKPGDGFGELAIMYNAPRAATCRVAEDAPAKVWALDRNSFRVIVVAAAMLRRETYQGFLAKVPILQTLTEMEIMTLADSLAEEKFKDGDVVCAQGEEGEYFYIIKEGGAVCSQVDAEGNDRTVATLTAGHYFGEISLLTTKPRQATVKAAGSLTVLAIDRATFTRVFGHLDDLMKRNMDEYNKYAAASI